MFSSYKITYNPVLAEELAAEELVKFTDKQGYLDWIVNWKDFYKNLAARQREIRLELKKPHSTFTQPGIDASALMSERQTNKWYLRILLQARRIAKKRSWKMKQDSKATV